MALNEFGFSSNSRQVSYSDDFSDSLVVLSARPLINDDVKMILGTREWTGDEKEFVDRNNVLNFSMRKITMDGLNENLDNLLEEARGLDSFELVLDLSVLDPAFCPSSEYPGGLSTRELIQALHRFRLLKNWKKVIVRNLSGDPVSKRVLEKLLKELL